MKHIKIITIVTCIVLLNALTGCTSNNSNGNEQSSNVSSAESTEYSEDTSTPSEAETTKEESNFEVEQQPSINTEWQYLEQEDKLNDLKNYEARILSTDGRVQCTVAALDLTGSGRYVNILGVAWFDETIPPCYGKTYIGMKFPGDSQWRKIIVSCKGQNGALEEDLRMTKEFGLLKSNSQFSILIANEEFHFKPSKPLKWNH